MATQFRSLVCKPSISPRMLTSLLNRSFSSPLSTATTASISLCRPLILRFVPSSIFNPPIVTASVRAYSTRRTSSSLNDPNPNWSNRPPKETILLDGCDFNHWLVVLEKPEGDPTRDEIIDSYIKTLAMVVGSEEEARMKIYSVSTKHYFAFGALVSEELSYKIKELPRVRWVLPDSYLDVKNKDYGGEPFINGEAVPYDPKYHEEWVRNNARAQERNRRNDRPRANDRSRNFNRRRENMQNQDVRYSPPSPIFNQGMPNSNPNMSGPPQGNLSGPPQGNMGGPTQGNFGGGGQPPFPPNAGGFPQNNGPPPSYSGYNNSGMQQNYPAPGGPPAHNNYNSGSGFQPNNMAQPPPTAGWSNNTSGANMQNNYPNNPNRGAMPYQDPPQNYQTGPSSGGMPYQGPPQNYQNSFIPSRD